MLARTAFAALVTVATLGLLAGPAAANCGEVGIPGKPPLLIIHC